MRRFTIMGFTEAELGFVLAALFVAVAAAAVNERDASAAGHDTVAASTDSLRAEAHAARDSLRAAHDRLDRVRDSLSVMRASELMLRDSLAVLAGKISTKVPQCWERGEPATPIADVAVIGADRYVINGDTLGIDGLRRRLATFLERGEALGCRYIVRARPMPGTDAVQQSTAVWQLRRWFDVNDRPR